MPRDGEYPSARRWSSLDDGHFEQEILAAEQELRKSSLQLQSSILSGSLTDHHKQIEDSMLFRGYNLLRGGYESLYRRELALEDARLASPRATLIITWIAWIMAVTAAFVAVMLLTMDFLDARSDSTLTTTFLPEERLALPVFSLCSSQLDVAPFPLFNRSQGAPFQGIPLFTVRSLEILENDSVTFWPDTLLSGVVTPAYRGPPDGTCLQRFRALDVNDDEDKTVTLGNEVLVDKCQYCFQIGRQPQLRLDAGILKRTRNEINPFAFRDGIRLHLVMVQYRNCLLTDDVYRAAGTDHWEFLKAEIIRAAPDLQRRGILDFSGVDDKEHPQEFKNLLPLSGRSNEAGIIKRGYPGVCLREIITSTREMLCNVYFWSGFFFPQASQSVDLRYQHNSTSREWDRVGTGPYLPETRTSAYRSALRSVKLEDQSNTMTSRPVEIYMEDPEELEDEGRLEAGSERDIIGSEFVHRVSDRAERIGMVDEGTLSQVRLNKVEKEDNQVSYRALVSQTDTETFGDARYLSYFVHFRFESFFTQRLSKRQEADWAPYLVDAVGYISMALGFTVYSLVVAPTNVFFFGFERMKKPKKDEEINKVLSARGGEERGRFWKRVRVRAFVGASESKGNKVLWKRENGIWR